MSRLEDLQTLDLEAKVELTKAQARFTNAEASRIEALVAGSVQPAVAPAAPSLSSDVGPAAKKAGRPKKEEAAPTPAPAAAPAAPVVKVDQKAEEEASKKLALDSASAYVRHFSKSTPDGMTRARAVLADKFGGKKIAELDHAQRLAFVGVLKSEMEPVAA